MNKSQYTIHTDGGSRGNPGPSAIGVVIEGADIGKKEYGEYIGETTNNVAEYKAVIYALKKLKQLIGSEKSGKSSATLFVDSELIERQVNGYYKVKEPDIRDLFLDFWNLRLDFKGVIVKHVRREKNTDADRLVNNALNERESVLDL